MGIFFNYDDSLFSDAPKADLPLSYDDCKKLFAEWTLGKRIVRSLPNFALSTRRDIIIQNAPIEAVEQFKKTCDAYNIDRVVKNASIINRIYGMCGILVTTNKEDDKFEYLTPEDLDTYKINFNVLDPLNFNITFSQDPSSFYFQKPTNGFVRGKPVDDKRLFVQTNGDPLYIEFENSTLNFAGRSVFKNMKDLYRSWYVLFSALEKIAVKASSILIKNENAVKDPMSMEFVKKSIEMFKQMEQGGIAHLAQGQEAEFFNLNGATEIGAMIAEVKSAIAIALEDTPLAILMDKSLSNGLSEGSEDMKAVVMAVENFRKDYLDPIYQFLDKFMFFKAWSDAWINEHIKPRYGEYVDLTPYEIRNQWIENFKFEWNSIYPETPDEKTKKEDGMMERLLKLKELGADVESLEDNLNDSKLFPNLITLTKIETPTFEMENVY